MTVILQKASRFASRSLSKSVLPMLDESIISFSFDDCPASAIETALPLLEAEGWRSTIYVACGLCDTTNYLGRHMSLSDIVDVHERGHEIGDHTYSHISGNVVSAEAYISDVARNQDTLKQLGLPPSRHFAYPFGHVSPSLKRRLGEQFETQRGVLLPTDAPQDANLLNAATVYSGPRYQKAMSKIEDAKATPHWLHLFTHDVRENPSDFGCSPDEFKAIVSAVKQSGLRVMTVDDAYRTITQGRSVS